VNHSRLLLFTLLAGFAVWLVFTWPLSRHVTTGIPASSRNIELGNVRAMMKGDQLQLLYHYRLMEGMITGHIPWFHNLYEFNTGDDSDRYFPSAYFFPFSVLYTAGAAVAGPAFGMNLVGLVSIWLTVYFTFLLVRRYATDPTICFFGALVSVLIPFRWAAQLGGSPGGNAMMYVPLIFYGLDVAIRDGKWRGGVLAGAGVLLACWGDVQVFFFATMAMPGWCLVAATRSWRTDEPWLKQIKCWIWTLSPVPVFLATAFGYRALLQPYLSGSVMSGGRTPAEVTLFSPTWEGLLSWANGGVNNHIYIGYTVPIWILAAAILFGIRMATRRSPVDASSAAFVLLCAGIIGAVCFALGFNGPFEGLPIRLARALVPPAEYMRQPARIYCLLPILMAAACCIGCRAWWDLLRPATARALVVLFTFLAVIEYGSQVRATVCLLDAEQGAYAAAAEQIESDADASRILVLPLWPGESDWSSLYQYYVSLYGVRMLNGYSPVVSKDYFENVFRRFESLNQGVVSDEQLEALRATGVRHLLLHENAFVEKVSPFPVMATIHRLLEHPRIHFLTQDGPVWVFALDEAAAAKGPEVILTHWYPARRCEFGPGGASALSGSLVEDAAAGQQTCLRLGPGHVAKTGTWRTGNAPGLRWSLRWRGKGTCVAHDVQQGIPIGKREVAVASDTWTWIDIPLTVRDGFAPVQLELEVLGGEIDLDLALLAAGRWPALMPGETLALPPRDFFHAGFSTPDGSSVHFRPVYEPDGAIFYGPHLPLAPGRYVLHLMTTSPADTGATLGTLQADPEAAQAEPLDVRAGESVEWLLNVTNDVPARFEFVYAREAEMTIDAIQLQRLE